MKDVSYYKNYFGKNLVTDPAHVFKQQSWNALREKIGLSIGVYWIWMVMQLVGLAFILLLAYLLGSSLVGAFWGGLAAGATSLLSGGDFFDAFAATIAPAILLQLALLLVAFVLFSFLGSIVEYGLSYMALRYNRNKEVGMGDGFAAFGNFGTVFSTYFMKQVFVLLWSLVPALCFSLLVAVPWLCFFTLATPFDGFSTTLFMTMLPPLVSIGIIISLPLGIIASLRYAFVLFVVVDNPDMGPLEAIRESKRLTYGNKGQLFVQWVSFSGWLVGVYLIPPVIVYLFALSHSFPVLIIGIVLSVIVFGTTAALLDFYRFGALAAFYDCAKADSPGNEAQQGGRRRQGQKSADEQPSITALTGVYQGATFRFEVDEDITIGRDAVLCDIIFDQNAEKVSRRHCVIRFDPRSRHYLVIDHSTNGTFKDDGSRLLANVENRLNRGERLILGDRKNTIRLD